MKKNSMYRCVSALLLFVFVSCDESLPPRNEPQQFLQANYSVVGGPVEVRDSTPVGLIGGFTVSVKNIYNEVLQEQEFAQVDVDVWMRDMPEQRGKAIALKRDLTNQSLVFGGLLTLHPNTIATFLKQWSHETTDGKHFWEFVGSHFVEVPFSNGYWESDSVHLVASGKVQLFKTRAPERLSPIHFTVVYRVWLP